MADAKSTSSSSTRSSANKAKQDKNSKSTSVGKMQDKITLAVRAAQSALVDIFDPAQDTEDLFHAAIAGLAPADDGSKILSKVTGANASAIDTANQTLQVSLAGDEQTFDTTQAGAAATLGAAIATFDGAVKAYLASTTRNQKVLHSAITVAQNAYERAKVQTDATSRQWDLYYTMQVAIATAINTAQTDKATNMGTLLNAFGTLSTSLGNYWGEVSDAKATQEIDDATAYETYWRTVGDILNPN